MALNDDDLKAVKQLLDGHFAEHRRIDRRRQARNWIIFLVLLIGPSIPAAIMLNNLWKDFQESLDQQQREFAEARAAYQRELKKSQIMQKERDEAVARSKYNANGNVSQADYEAGLLRSMIQFYNKQGKIRDNLKNVDADDPDSLEATADELSGILDDSLGLLMQMALRNTDPAIDPPADERKLSDGKMPDQGVPVPAQ
jgi:hypothetical protein